MVGGGGGGLCGKRVGFYWGLGLGDGLRLGLVFEE